jgi:hypothetical protein
MPDQVGDSGEFTLRYPVFAVVAPDEDGEDGLVVVEVEGKECILLFRSREVGELYLEQLQSAAQPGAFGLQEQRGDEELRHLLDQLPPSVEGVVWDSSLRPRAVMMTTVPDLLAVLDKGP